MYHKLQFTNFTNSNFKFQKFTNSNFLLTSCVELLPSYTETAPLDVVLPDATSSNPWGKTSSAISSKRSIWLLSGGSEKSLATTSVLQESVEYNNGIGVGNGKDVSGTVSLIHTLSIFIPHEKRSEQKGQDVEDWLQAAAEMPILLSYRVACENPQKVPHFHMYIGCGLKVNILLQHPPLIWTAWSVTLIIRIIVIVTALSLLEVERGNY